MVTSVNDWMKHVEISVGFCEGTTTIGDIGWTRNIYNDFCNGEPSFGANTTNAMEATLTIIKQHDPSKYNLALTGLRRTIEQERKNGKALIKLEKMYIRMGGRPISLTILDKS